MKGYGMGEEGEDLQTEVTQEIIDEWVRRDLAIIEDEKTASDRMVEIIFERGQLYLEIKKRVGHGSFTKMFKDKGGPLPTTSSTARRYAKIAENEVLQKHASSRVLPASCHALYELARLRAAHLEALIQAGKVHPNITAEGVKAVSAGKVDKSMREAQSKDPEKRDQPQLGDLTELLLELKHVYYKIGAREMGAAEMAKRLVSDCDVTDRSLLLDVEALLQDLEINELHNEVLMLLLEMANAQSSEKQAIPRKRLKDDPEREATVH